MSMLQAIEYEILKRGGTLEDAREIYEALLEDEEREEE